MIQWNLFPEAFNRQQENINEQYDFSYVTPELVRGFSRYQALRPEQDVKRANKYKEILENINDEDLNTIFGNELDEEVKQAVDWDSPDEKDTDEKWKEWRKTAAEQRNRKAMFNPSVPDGGSPLLPESEEAGVVLGQPKETPYESTYDRDALVEKYMRNTLGSDYDDYKRAYDIYGKMNPYEQMIQAGKRSSYWDPEIGKIYTDAGERIRNDRITAWKEALDGETMLQRQAMDMFKQTGLSRYRREAERRLDRITDLLKSNPRNEGQWFEGYETAEATTPEVASAYGEIEKRILDEGPMSEVELMTFINEKGLKGEDVTDLLKQNDAEWEKRYGTDAAVTKRTEEAIRAQSESFKTDQRKRMDRMDQLEDLQNKLADTKAGEATYRLAAETLKKMDLDITQSFDEKTKRAIEQAKNRMVANPSFSTVGAFLLLVGADKIGLTPRDMNALSSDNERKKLIKDAVNALYETDLNMYNVARTRMLNDLEGVRGIDPARLSWMRERKPVEIAPSEKTPDDNVDVDGLDWSEATYQISTVKKELKKALEGQASKFKKQADGSYQWIGGKMVHTFYPTTGKVVQSQRKPPSQNGGEEKDVVPVNNEEALLKALMGQG